MTEFVSIYRKDYLWPDRKVSLMRSGFDCTIAVPVNLQFSDSQTHKKDDENQFNSTTQPIFKVGPCPTTDKLEFNETDTCLKQLLQKNPNLINVMRRPPTFDALNKFNLERLKTTYQVDFDHLEDQSEIDMAGLPLKPTICSLNEDFPTVTDCQPRLNSRIALIKSRGMPVYIPKDPCKKKFKVIKRKRPDDEDEVGRKAKVLTAWSSEYRDAINKTGDHIMKEVRLSSKHKIIREKLKLLKVNECEDNINQG